MNKDMHAPARDEGERSLVGQLGGLEITLPSSDKQGYNVRGHLWTSQTESRGKILILPGFTEFCEKYALTARHLVNAGYECLIIDWPGQGKSGHLGANLLVAHIDHFDQHLAALDALLSKTGYLQKKFHLLGHSMGGHLALNAAQIYSSQVISTILLAPMIVPVGPPVWVTKWLAKLLIMAGMRRRSLPFRPPLSQKKARQFRPNNALTRFPEGYDRQYQIFDIYPELRRARPSVGWVAAAYASCARTTLNPDWMKQISGPVLSLLPGDDRVVNSARTNQMLGYLNNHQSVAFADARHELLNEFPDVTNKVFTEIERFLGEL